MEKLKVKFAVISKQEENSPNYAYFKKLANKRKIKIITVKAGDKLQIDKKCYIDILFPTDALISTNAINNNSIVAKFCYRYSDLQEHLEKTKISEKQQNYKEISLLLTGDIEEIAERKLLELHKNENMLNATILKVAHHGSKTSSTQEFLNRVKPKIALIGVGENNTFGHPNKTTLNKLEYIRF